MTVIGIDRSKETLKEEIIAVAGVEPRKIRNIYIFGSRVYGLHTVNSDYDAIVTATSMYVNHEIFEGDYNIHITTPDSFEDKLRQHDVHCLECIFAPDEARIHITTNYRDAFRLNKMKLKKMLLTQSAAAWAKSRRRIEQGNIMGGAKSIFHSLRILKFGVQILEHGRIIDFEAANKLWYKIEGFDEFEWIEYKGQFNQIRTQYMKEFKKFGQPFPNVSVVREALESAIQIGE